jgi:uncharacterized protein YoxC
MTAGHLAALAAVLAVVLLAVLVGAAIPALLELRSTLRTARAFMDEARVKVDTTLAAVTRASERVQAAGAELHAVAKNAKEVSEPLADLAQSLGQVRESLRTAAAIGSAIGPAAVAAVRAVMASRQQREAAREAAGCCDASEDNGVEHAAACAPRMNPKESASS